MIDFKFGSRFNSRRAGRAFIVAALCMALQGAWGCVERTVSINSEPAGALVYLNDQEVGRAPVKVNFTWYGDYDIILRKEGYETLQTNRRIDAPWYQWPVIDLVAECMIPTTIRDDRDLGTFTLTKAEFPTKEELIRNAEEMRTMAAGAAAKDDPPVSNAAE